VSEGRQLVHGLCDELGLRYTDAVGNFSFIDPKMSNAEFKKRMKSHGLEAARSFPPMPDWARVTIGTTEEMAVFAEALPKIVAG
jgi:histidinol-phosphate aminotransferase